MNTEALTKKCPKCGEVIPSDAPQELCPRCLLLQASLPTEGGKHAPGSTAPTREEVAAAFPQLEIAAFIGQGGMGYVFKARQPKLDRWVALKILPPSLGADPAFAERFHREGRVLARLNHPNIVTVHDFGQANGFFYLLMEFVDGVNLRQAMRAGRFTPRQALEIVPRICDALQYAHNEGVLHRDIKPENILLDSKGRVKIADFGIAKLRGEPGPGAGLTATGERLGTPHYMAPEQIERPSDVDHRADIYSLGVVFYELLTGELPLGRFAPPSSKSEVGAQVDEIVLRALAKERELRQQSAGEVKTQVETVSARSGNRRDPPARPAESRLTPVPGWPRTPAWIIRAGLVFLALGGLSILWPYLYTPRFSAFAWNSACLLAITGIALLTGTLLARRVALLCSCVGLLVSAMSVISLAQFAPYAMGSWHPESWVPLGVPANFVVDPIGLAARSFLSTLLHITGFLASVWVLSRPDVKEVFEKRSQAAGTHPELAVAFHVVFWIVAIIVLAPFGFWFVRVLEQSIYSWVIRFS